MLLFVVVVVVCGFVVGWCVCDGFGCVGFACGVCLCLVVCVCVV